MASGSCVRRRSPRGNHVVANSPAPTVHVYGDDLSAIIGFDLLPDVPLIHLVAEAGAVSSLGRRGDMAASFPCVMAGVSASLIRPPFQRPNSTGDIIRSWTVFGNKKARIHRRSVGLLPTNSHNA